MPRIQEYNQQVDIQQPATQQVQMENFTGGWKNATEAFATLDDITKKFETLRNEKEVIKAANDFQIELAQIESEADSDPDVNNASSYKEKIDSALSKHTQSISSNILRDKAIESFRLKGYTTNSNIQAKFNKQVVEQAQDELFKNIDLSRQAYISTVDPVKKRQLSDGVLERIDAGVASGYLTAESARSLREDVKTDWVNSEASFDAHNNPELFMEEATRPDGKFSSLSPDSKVKLLDYAIRRKEKLQKEADDRVEKEKAKTKADQLALGDDLTIEDVMLANANGVYESPEEAKRFMDFAINGMDIEAKTNSTTYTELMNDFFSLGKRDGNKKLITESSKNADAIHAFRMKARQANLDKKLSNADYRDLIDGSQKIFDVAVRKDVEKRKGAWDNFGNWLKFWEDTYEGDVEAKKNEYMAEFNRRVIVKDEQADTVTTEMQLRAATEKYPWISGKKIGDTITNKFGVKRVFRGFDQNGVPQLEAVK